MARHERTPPPRAIARAASDDEPVRDTGDDEEDELDEEEDEDLDEEEDEGVIVDEEMRHETRPTGEVGSEGGTEGRRRITRPQPGTMRGSEATEMDESDGPPPRRSDRR